jgi:adenylate cyclase
VTGHQRWGERYDRTLDDMFAVQDDITRRVTVELQVQLTEGEQARVWSRGTSDFEAWENAVRGAAMLSRQLRDETRRARELSEAALRADPCFPSAWMVRGWALYQQFTNGWSDEPEQTLALAIEAGNRALELDPSHADSLCLLGVLRCVQGDFPGALVLMEQAVGLAPHNAWILALSANVLAFAGRSHGAVPRIQRAIELSPIHPLWFVTILGNCHFQAGDFDLAVGAFERAVARSPGSMVPRIYLVYALVGQRSLEEARAAAQAVLDMKPDFSIAEWERRFPYRHAPVFETLRTSLRIAGLPT